MNIRQHSQRVTFLILLLSGVGVSACAGTRQASTPSFYTDLEAEETDGILIEWRNCSQAAPCMTGNLAGKPYNLYFPDSPSNVAGTVGGKAVKLVLQAQSVFRLGDHAIELVYLDRRSGATLEVSWNEQDQVLIDHNFMPGKSP